MHGPSVLVGYHATTMQQMADGSFGRPPVANFNCNNTPIQQDWSSAPPLATQVGGQHYKKFKIQPVEYVHANNLGYFEGSVIKYVSRWRDKGGIDDLKKAIHFIELLIELEAKKDVP